MNAQLWNKTKCIATTLSSSVTVCHFNKGESVVIFIFEMVAASLVIWLPHSASQREVRQEHLAKAGVVLSKQHAQTAQHDIVQHTTTQHSRARHSRAEHSSRPQTEAHSGLVTVVAHSSKRLGKLPQKRSQVISSVPRLPYICSSAEPKLRHHHSRTSGLRMTWWGPVCRLASLQATSCATRLASTALARCNAPSKLGSCCADDDVAVQVVMPHTRGTLLANSMGALQVQGSGTVQ